MTALPLSPRVTICTASLTAPRLAEIDPAGIEPAGIEPAGMEPAGTAAGGSGGAAPRPLSPPGPESSIPMLPAGIDPAGLLGCTVGAPGLFSARSRSVPAAVFRYAATFVPGARPLSEKR